MKSEEYKDSNMNIESNDIVIKIEENDNVNNGDFEQQEEKFEKSITAASVDCSDLSGIVDTPMAEERSKMMEKLDQRWFVKFATSVAPVSTLGKKKALKR